MLEYAKIKFMNNSELQRQINENFKQYKLEIQNQELQAQVQQANQTIAAQNQHMEHIYAGMGLTVTVLGILLTFLGIVVPICILAISNNFQKELKEARDEVDNFINRKFSEWEKEESENAIEKFLSGEITWQELHTILKYRLLTYEQMYRIYTIANNNSKVEQLRLLFHYVFEYHFDIKSDEYERIRDLILHNRLFCLFTRCRLSKAVINSFSTLTDIGKEAKINELIDCAEQGTFISFLQDLSSKDYINLTKNNIQNIVNKLMAPSNGQYITAIQNNQKIINPLFEAGFFERIKINGVNNKTANLIIDNAHISIETSSYFYQCIENEIVRRRIKENLS